MKTQIKNLINGCDNVRRDLNNEKYISAPEGSNSKYAGTNREYRYSLRELVHAENPDGMVINFFGKTFQLTRSSSLSGKTVWFSCELSLEDVLALSIFQKSPYTYESTYELVIDDNLTVMLRSFTRKSPNAEWKYRGFFYMDESFVTIL